MQKLLREEFLRLKSLTEKEYSSIALPWYRSNPVDDDVAFKYFLVDGNLVLRPQLSVFRSHKGERHTLKEIFLGTVAGNIAKPSIISNDTGNLYDHAREKTVRVALYGLLAKFPLSCLLCCPECSTYFKSTARKESPLCERCLKKENTRRWREQNRPVYNAYQRNLAKGLKTSVEEIREDLKKEENNKE